MFDCSICVLQRNQHCADVHEDEPTLISVRWWRRPLLLGTRALICVCTVHTEVEAVKKKEKKH